MCSYVLPPQALAGSLICTGSLSVVLCVKSLCNRDKWGDWNGHVKAVSTVSYR